MDVSTIHAFLAALRNDFGVAIDYEDILERQYRAFLPPDGVVVDVGAHMGRHTRAFVEACPRGRVLAVEPLPDQAAHLRETLGARIDLFEGALGARSGRTRFVWARGTPEESGLRRRAYNDPDRAQPIEIEVEVRTLDELGRGLDRCDFVKVDVEGAELTALSGGREFLARTRPVLSVEYGRPAYSAYGHEAGDLFAFARDNGFVVHDLFLNVVPDEETWRAVVDGATWDFFLVPDEKTPLVLDRGRIDIGLMAPTQSMAEAATRPTATAEPGPLKAFLDRVFSR